MPGDSRIERTDTTWNPVTGCTKVLAGCGHCYAERFAERFRGVPGHPYERGFDPRLWPERLAIPLRWQRPRARRSHLDEVLAQHPDTATARATTGGRT
jgi:protein gp37